MAILTTTHLKRSCSSSPLLWRAWEHRHDIFLQDALIVNIVLGSMLFASAPLGPLFPRRISVSPLCRGALISREPVYSFLSEVSCWAKSWTFAFFLVPQYEHILNRMDFSNFWIKLPLSTSLSCALLHRSVLFQRALAYFVGNLLDGWAKPIISESGSEIMSPLLYVSSKLLTYSQ